MSRHKPLVDRYALLSSERCWWLNPETDKVETVHLWGSFSNGTDSVRGEVYPVRRCLVCNTVDLDSIMASWQRKEDESGREVQAEEEGAPAISVPD